MKMGKAQRPATAWLVFALAAALLSPAAAVASDLTSINPSPTAKLKVGGALMLPITHEPAQFNPWHIDGNDKEINRMMSASLPLLMISDGQGKLTPNKNYITTFTQTKLTPQTFSILLNPKAVWSDGKKLSLADFTGMWRALNGKNPSFGIVSSTGYENIKSVTAGKSANEIIVVLSKPYPDWQELFSPLLPSTLTKDSGAFNGAWRAKPLLSAGPFTFDSMNREQGSITWIRNPKWWGAKPLLDNLTFRILPSESQIAALLNDELSFVDVTSDASTIRQVRNNPKFIVHAVASSEQWEQIAINSENPILSDVLVRQALSVAFNREALAEVNTGLFVAATSPKNNRIFSLGQLCYKDTSGNWSKQDISRADQLLEQSGWLAATNTLEKDSTGKNKIIGMRYFAGAIRPGLVLNQPLTLRYIYPAGNQARENTGLLLQAMLRAKPIGIDLQLIEVSAEDYFTKYVNPTSLGFDLAAFSWSSSTLPISGALNLYRKNSNQNFAKDSISAQLDSLIKKAQTEVNPTQRCALANQIDAQLWESAYNIPLYNWPAASITVKNLANFGSFGFTSIDWTKIGFMK